MARPVCMLTLEGSSGTATTPMLSVMPMLLFWDVNMSKRHVFPCIDEQSSSFWEEMFYPPLPGYEWIYQFCSEKRFCSTHLPVPCLEHPYNLLYFSISLFGFFSHDSSGTFFSPKKSLCWNEKRKYENKEGRKETKALPLLVVYNFLFSLCKVACPLEGFLLSGRTPLPGITVDWTAVLSSSSQGCCHGISSCVLNQVFSLDTSETPE